MLRGRNALLVLALILALMSLGGCGGGGSNPNPPPAQLLDTTTAIVPTTGGTLTTSPATDVKVNIAPGSLSAATAITLNVYDATGLPIANPDQQAASNTIAITGLSTLTAGGSLTITAPMSVASDAASGFVVMSDGSDFYNAFIPSFNPQTQEFSFIVTAADVEFFTRGRGTRVPRDFRWKLQHYTLSSQQPGANINRFIATSPPNPKSWSAWQEQTAVDDWSNDHVAVILHGIFHDLSDMNELAWFLSQLPLDPTQPPGPNNRRYAHIYGIDYRWQAEIDKNAEIVAEDLAANNATDIDVYGYSMGGLVARSAIEQYGSSTRVKRLFMIGTPNEGVPLRGLALLTSPGLYAGVYLTLPGINDLAQHGSFLNILDNGTDISGSNSVVYYTFAGTHWQGYLGPVGSAIHAVYHAEDTDNNGAADDQLDGIVPLSSAHYRGLSRKCADHIRASTDFDLNHSQLSGEGNLNLNPLLGNYILNTGGIDIGIE